MIHIRIVQGTEISGEGVNVHVILQRVSVRSFNLWCIFFNEADIIIIIIMIMIIIIKIMMGIRV